MIRPQRETELAAPSRAPHSAPRVVSRAASRWTHFALWALVSTLLCLGLQRANWRWSSFLDNACLDAFFALRGAHSPQEVAEKLPQSRDIIIVELRHDTPRDVLARLLPKLKMARAVGLDLMFVDQTALLSSDERALYRDEIARWKGEDAVLARAIGAAGNVVVGAWNERLPPEPNEKVPRFRWETPALTLARGARAKCHLSVVPDVQDGIIRRVKLWETVGRNPLWHQVAQDRVPALGLALAALYSGTSPQKLGWQRDGKSALPLNSASVGASASASAGATLINYLGPREVWEYPSNHIVFERALDSDAEDFAGKIVLVGQTDARSKDIFPTPYGDMPGLYIHANLVATLLDPAGPPRPLSPLVTAGISLFLALVLVATLARFPVWACAPVGILEMLLVAALAMWLFGRCNWILPLSVPFGALFWTYNGVALYEYRRARRTLGRVVGQNTAAQLLDTFDNPHLGGKLQNATAFFCDLRGYSTMSERLAPQQLIALLNLYTAAVVREVEAQGGRPIDYFGDGVFVLFEDEGDQNHASQAVRAALATQCAITAQMQELQSAAGIDPRVQGAASTPLVAGIALHTGPMVIGLVGADTHLKPGAVGDAVNVAARLQGLSEQCGFPILLSRATLDACLKAGEEPLDATFCGEFPIKGRQSLIEVFGLKAPGPGSSPGPSPGPSPGE